MSSQQESRDRALLIFLSCTVDGESVHSTYIGRYARHFVVGLRLSPRGLEVETCRVIPRPRRVDTARGRRQNPRRVLGSMSGAAELFRASLADCPSVGTNLRMLARPYNPLRSDATSVQTPPSAAEFWSSGPRIHRSERLVHSQKWSISHAQLPRIYECERILKRRFRQ